MSWSAAVNVAVGLILLYFLFSLAASRINEFVVSRLQWRANGLERALLNLVGGEGKPPLKSIAAPMDGTPPDPAKIADILDFPELSALAVKNHQIVTAFESSLAEGRRISYLPSRAFSAVVLDILAPPAGVLAASIPTGNLDANAKTAVEVLAAHPDADHLAAARTALGAHQNDDDIAPLLTRIQTAISDDPLEQARVSVLQLPVKNPARRPLLRMLTDAEDDRDKFRAKLEHWYDDEMSRLTGWYKRRVQKFILVYSIGLTLLFNVDTISIAQNLWRSPVEQAAAAQAAATAAGKTVDQIDTSVTAIRGLAMPLGWTPLHAGSTVSTDPRHFPGSFGGWLVKVLGLAITVGALAFGAPFWFDVLGKIARVRNAGGVTSSTEDSARN
jgi:hypothetical protein